MQKTISFKKKVIASAIASALAGISVSALAQSTDTVEEIVVSGIRASLTRAMDIKRDASGVVEGISAEDIGVARASKGGAFAFDLDSALSFRRLEEQLGYGGHEKGAF